MFEGFSREAARWSPAKKQQTVTDRPTPFRQQQYPGEGPGQGKITPHTQGKDQAKEKKKPHTHGHIHTHTQAQPSWRSEFHLVLYYSLRPCLLSGLEEWRCAHVSPGCAGTNSDLHLK